MRIIGMSLLAAIGGYAAGLFGGMALVDRFSSNTHDRAVEAAMTSAFCYGPLVALLAAVLTFVYLSRRGV